MIVAEVEFAEITPDGQVRHASFVGPAREDKGPAVVVHEADLLVLGIEYLRSAR